MKFTLKKRLVQGRDYSHRKTLGASNLVIPPPGTIKSFNVPITDQGSQNDCTAFAAVEIRQAKTGNVYDAEQFWTAEKTIYGDPNNTTGVDLQTQGATGVKIGWTLAGQTTPSEKAGAYVFVQPSLFSGPDTFDLLRATMITQGPLSGGLDWYSEWTNTPGGIIPHSQANLLGGHDVTLAALNYINAVDYIDLSVHWGPNVGDHALYHLDRYMANKVFSGYGVLYWVDGDQTFQRTGLLEALLVNLLNLYRRLLGSYPPKLTPPSPPPAPHVSRISDWANAIAKVEGAKPALNNPGNLKVSTLTKSWGALPGFNATDGGTIASFPTPELGMTALCNFLTLGCENQLIAFHQARTLAQFTKIYAGNPPPHYLNSICTDLKVASTINISSLL
jgi:hypothetical protein